MPDQPREWCIRCNEVYVEDEPAVCPNAPDRGPHEALVWPPEAASGPVEMRPGYSLHVVECPRSNSHPGLPAYVPCSCPRTAPMNEDGLVGVLDAYAMKERLDAERAK